MVEQAYDKTLFPFHYANFRTDKEPSPGYSAELISKNVEKEYFDNLEGRPFPA